MLCAFLYRRRLTKSSVCYFTIKKLFYRAVEKVASKTENHVIYKAVEKVASKKQTAFSCPVAFATFCEPPEHLYCPVEYI